MADRIMVSIFEFFFKSWRYSKNRKEIEIKKSLRFEDTK